MGDPEKSIKVYEKALKKVGSNYLLHYNAGVSYINLGNWEKAREHAIQGIELNPNHTSSHFLLANIENKFNNKV